MAKKILGILSLTVILLSIDSKVTAQSYAESALLFSRTQPGGSARIQAMGGSQIALGGDYSSTLSNPAGLGMFNRSEFTFTPAITSYSTTANFLGNQNKDNFSKFSVPGLSYVHHMSRDNNGFLGGSFGISMTRTNDFNSSTLYCGRNNLNSMVDYFLDQADGDTPDQFDSYQYNTPTGLAYYTFLIGPRSILDPPGPNNQYFTDAPIASDQQENINVAGSTYQWSFSYGANFNDKIFFGGGIGLATLKYESEKLFSEEYVDRDTIDNILLTENLDIRGSGINATFGVIARPVDFLQIGLSFVTPTYYQLSETYDARLDASWVDYDYWDGDKYVNLNDEYAATDFVVSDYSLTTPFKLSAGIAFISKFGFITGDIELTNPEKAKYKSQTSGVSYSNENQDISESFKNVLNYRLGAEFRYNKFRLRAGYNLQGSPYQSREIKNTISSISGGAGIRLDKFYADLAVISKKSESNYSPYVLNDNLQPVVNLTHKTLTTMLTLGFTF